MDQPKAPSDLSQRSQSLWREYAGSRVKGTGRLIMLEIALRHFDLADEARRKRIEVGLTTKTERSGVEHLTPCLKIEKEATQLFLKIWQKLNLHLLPMK